MAEQNKTVTIAVIAVLVIAVIAVGSWLVLSGPSAAPTTVVQPTPPSTDAPAVEQDKKPKAKAKPKARGSSRSGVKEPDDPVYDIPGRKPRADEMTSEERKRKRGDTTKPRGPMP